MFKNKQSAVKQLADRLNNDRVGERSIKIISLTSQGQKLAKLLKQELNLKTDNQKISQDDTVIIADDGNISFSKLRGKIFELRQKNIKKILIAMPVYEHEKIRELEKTADGVYIIEQPKVFMSADDFYKE